MKLVQMKMKRFERRYFRTVISILWLSVAILSCSVIVNNRLNPPDFMVYSDELRMFVFPINMGFNIESLKAMVATLLLGIILYAALKKGRKSLIITWTCCNLLFNIVGYKYVYLQSYARLCFLMTGFEDIKFESKFRYLFIGCLVLLIVTMAMLILYGSDILNRKTKLKRKSCGFYFYCIIVLINIMSAGLLYIRSFTNVWYFYVCMITSIVVLFVLILVDKLRGVTNYDKKWSVSYSVSELINYLVNGYVIGKFLSYESDDDNNAYIPSRHNGWSIVKGDGNIDKEV